MIFEPSELGDDPKLFERSVIASQIVKYADNRIASLAKHNDWRGIEIQTRGERGLGFRAEATAWEWMEFGAFEIPGMRDTAGAGDWCTAGIAYELHREGRPDLRKITRTDLTHAILFGQILASLNCTTVGALGLLPAIRIEGVIEFARQLARIRTLSDCPIRRSDELIKDITLTEFCNRLSRVLRATVPNSLSDDFPCCRAS